jgi:hypothetical protein
MIILLALVAALSMASAPAQAFRDTEAWMGAEYTPAAAPGNGFWWQWYDDYEPSVERELAFLSRNLKLTTIRVWLMYEVYAANSTRLHDNMESFLGIAEKHGIKVGFVFFGDCFNHNGGNTSVQCTPHKGHHNGCWMASPQDVDRPPAPFLPLKPYVVTTIGRFKSDQRVQWWEIFNEPRHDSYSLGLRNEAYTWAKALAPLAPVMSCWDDSNNTDIVDHHDYGTAFKSGWQHALYSDPAKGAVVTEGGSRWYQPDPRIKPGAKTNQQDQGSPLTVLRRPMALSPTCQAPWSAGS